MLGWSFSPNAVDMQSAPSAWIVMTSMPHEDSDEARVTKSLMGK